MKGLAGTIMALILGVFPGCHNSASGGFTAHRDIAYSTIPGVNPNLLSLDVYTPEPKPAQPVPVVLWVHGGGWAIGDKAYQMWYKPALFTGAGYCFVSINYRLSPRPASTNPTRIMYPVHEQDVAAAIAWVHAHIGEYGGDPGKIALMGHSAGAHLVAIVSTDESFLAKHNLPLSVIKGTASVDTEGYDIPRTVTGGQLGEIYRNAFGDNPLVWAAASPVNHVAAGKGIPPFLLTARGAAFRQGLCNDFAGALKKAGVSATVLDASAYSHMEVNSNIGAPGETFITPPLMAFFKACFGGG